MTTINPKEYIDSITLSNMLDKVIIDAFKTKRRQSFEQQIDARIEASRKQIASGDTISIDDYFDRKIARLKEKI